MLEKFDTDCRKVMKTLTKQGRTEAGSTAESRLQFIREKVFPFEYKSLEDFVFHQLLNDVDEWEKQYSDLVEDNRNYATIFPKKCVKQDQKGLPLFVMSIFICFLILFKHKSEIGVANFIPMVCDTDSANWENKLKKDFRQALLFSRWNYVTKNTLLPIIIEVGLDYSIASPYYGLSGHVVSFMFIPDNETLSWNRILINSNGGTWARNIDERNELDRLQNHVAKVLDDVWVDYQTFKDVYQKDIIVADYHEIFKDKALQTDCFTTEVQGAFPNCSLWCFGFVVNFLYSYDKYPGRMSNPDIMRDWCEQFQNYLTPEKRVKFSLNY